MAGTTPGPAKYADNSETPLTEEERKRIERYTSDPLSFSDQFVYWLNNKFIQNFEPLPHGCQIWLSGDFTNGTTGTPELITFDTVEHDTNAYFVAADNNLVIPPKLGGVYSISAVFEYDTTNHGTAPAAAIYVNDVPVVVAPCPVTGTGFDLGVHMMLARTIHLNAGDVVDVRTYKSGGTQVVKATGSTGLVAALNIARIYAIDDYVTPCVAPVNTVAPTLTPTSRDQGSGAAITVNSNGTWTGTATILFTYQWQSQNEGAGPWVDITGETGSTLDPVTSYVVDYGLDSGDKIRCVVTGTNGCGSSTANTNECTLTAE